MLGIRVSKLSLLLLAALPLGVVAQSVDSMTVTDKLFFHAKSVYSLGALLESGAYAGFLQEDNAPREWGQGAGAYAERFASTNAANTIYAGLAFGLDSTLHQDPRYYPCTGTGFWRRTGHAVRATILTRTDSGGETLSTWRLGGAYGAAFLSNEWYPQRLNTVRLGAIEGSLWMGFDLVANLGREFWPDIKRRLPRRKP
ncbi:MAG: hypothetical protein ACLQBJ_14075 [Bryobacteraceae bacterium]